MPVIGGLDDACPVCGRPAGDHTLREWAVCVGDTTEIPFHRTTGTEAEQLTAEMQRRFGIEDDMLVADNVVIHAGTLDGYSGIVKVRTPILIHDFGINVGDRTETVAKVVFLAPVDGVRSYGRLVFDNAIAAAKAAEA